MPPVRKKVMDVGLEPTSVMNPDAPVYPQPAVRPGAIVTILAVRGTYADVEVLCVAPTHLEVAGQIHLPPYSAVLALPWASILTISVMG
jgi:hypothetical protein